MTSPSTIAAHLLSSPNLAVCAATLGILLVFVEFNRPGSILPAASGLLLTLLASASLLRFGVQLGPAFLLIAAAVVLALNAWRRFPTTLLIAITPALIAGLRFLVPPSHTSPVSWPVATLCGLALSLVSAFLTRVAYRARRAKALD